MIRLLLVSTCLATAYCNWDPLDAHDGVFRSLKLNQHDLKLVSRLHATASYHELFDFVRERLNYLPNLSFEDRKKIERFLVKNRPPMAIKTFLDDADRNYIAVLHSQGDIPESMSVVEKGILQLPKMDRRKVVEYIWKKPEPFMFEHFGLEP